MSAYEELKAWCEKHLLSKDYEAREGIIILKGFEVEENFYENKTNIYFLEDGSLFQRQTH